MSDGFETCGAKAVEQSQSPAYVRALWIVVSLNAAMFVVGLVVTLSGSSVSVRADMLDFLGDAVATGVGLLLISKPPRTRAVAGLWQGLALGALGLFTLATAFGRVFGGEVPEPLGMGIYGILGLAVNLGAALMLLRHRHGDASARAVWLYSRNDAVGNLAVLAAAGLVLLMRSPWPDTVAGVAISLLFLHSAAEIIRGARREMRNAQV